jgi:hypothetical protein
MDAEHATMQELLRAWNPYAWPPADNITSEVSSVLQIIPISLFRGAVYWQLPCRTSVVVLSLLLADERG